MCAWVVADPGCVACAAAAVVLPGTGDGAPRPRHLAVSAWGFLLWTKGFLIVCCGHIKSIPAVISTPQTQTAVHLSREQIFPWQADRRQSILAKTQSSSSSEILSSAAMSRWIGASWGQAFALVHLHLQTGYL